MAQRPALHFGADFAPRGLDLAERRLAYLAELYDSGRWRRYFRGDADFLLMVREARAAVESWRQLLRAKPVEAWQTTSVRTITDHRATLAPPDPCEFDDVDGFDDVVASPDLGTRLPPVAFSRHAVVAEGDLAEA
jgi:uncharacterized repeat protein (TIGR03809 family)